MHKQSCLLDLRLSQQWLRSVLAVYSVESQQTFRRNISPPSSGSNKPSKVPAWKQAESRVIGWPEISDHIGNPLFFKNTKIGSRKIILPVLAYDCETWSLTQIVSPAFALVSCSAYSTVKMEAICCSETSVDFQRTTRRYIPEDTALQLW
jgi:hypothetical protein